MNIPRFTLSTKDRRKAPGGCVAMLVPQDKELFASQREELGQQFQGSVPLLGSQAFMGKDTDVVVLTPHTHEGRPLIVVGLGLMNHLTAERLRRAAALAAKHASLLKQTELLIEVPRFLLEKDAPLGLEPQREERIATALLEGAALGLYRFDKYKSANHEPTIAQITLLVPDSGTLQHFQKGTRLAETLVEGVWLARDLANAPGNEIFPESFAATAKSVGRKNGFTVTVFDEKKILSLGMGGLTGVAKGSAKPPRFIILQYGVRSGHAAPIVLVGKGVTFDAGGISIKPSANMAEMKMDMAGAAAVLGTFLTVSRLKLAVPLVGLIPVAENLPGGNALKPGDILRHYNGKTSEIDNTDAEGRLILADALSYASQFKPAAVIDLATLTGAVVVALGHFATGLLGNDADLLTSLKASGERTGERVWELPMFEEYAGLLKSDVADVKNVGGRWAGAITGAMFLKQFVGSYPWAHLDIAGTAITEEALGYIPKGGSGVGVRLLTDYLQHRAGPGHKT